MEKILNFVKSLNRWPKILATLGLLALLGAWLWSCTAQKTLRVSGTVENATFDYNSDGTINITK